LLPVLGLYPLFWLTTLLLRVAVARLGYMAAAVLVVC
jgi:hypothetical protein